MARRVADVGPRRRAVLEGTVASVTARAIDRATRTPRGPARMGGATGGPGADGVRLEVLLTDRTGELELWWLGRWHVPGIVAAARLRVAGTVLLRRGQLVMLNPLYEFAPPGGRCGLSDGTDGADGADGRAVDD